MQSVAVLGVGTMGSAFARRLLGAGMRVSVWDVFPAAAARLAGAGAQVGATVEEAVHDAGVVLTMVPTVAAIEETMPRVLAAMPQGATWLQMSTIGVDGTERAIALAEAHRPDVVFVDAPVSGSRAPAEEGKLLILASGPRAGLDALEPVFSVLGQKTMRWERAGTGSRMKLVLNTWLAALGEGIAEVAVLARSLGVSLDDVSACVGSTALDAPWALSKLDKIEHDAFNADFSLALAAKDLHLALDAADGAHQRLPIAQAIAVQWDSALHAGFGDRDVVGAYLALTADQPALENEMQSWPTEESKPHGAHEHMKPKNTICLWFDKEAHEAARFYAATFPDSEVTAVHKAPGDYPGGKEGNVLTVEFTVLGTPCLGLNGGPVFKHSEAFSFQVATDNQKETDRYWNAIVGNGGQESQCGWCKDRWGLSWQITPRALTEALAAGGAEAKRAFEAMMPMKKIDIATIEAARRG